MNIKKVTLFLLLLASPTLLFAARPSIVGLQVELNQLKERVADLEHNGAIYRWTQWSTYDQAGGWFAGNDASLFGGVNPSSWTDAGYLASHMSADKEVLRTLFTRKGYAGKNALVVADEYMMYSSTNGRMAGVLFRIKNTTANPISWSLFSRLTAYGNWGEKASIAVNGSLVWQSGTASLNAANSAASTTISIPPNQTSTVIVIAGSGPAQNINSGISLRSNLLAFYNNSLELPAGLEYVDDLDTATGGWSE